MVDRSERIAVGASYRVDVRQEFGVGAIWRFWGRFGARFVYKGCETADKSSIKAKWGWWGRPNSSARSGVSGLAGLVRSGVDSDGVFW